MAAEPADTEPEAAQPKVSDLVETESEAAGLVETAPPEAELEAAEPMDPEPQAAELEAVEPEAAEAEAADDELEAADPADRRSHERVSAGYEINIEASLSLGGHEIMRLELTGTTIDISHCGMLIRVEQEVLPGARCDAHFVDSKGKIEPERIAGRVRRAAKVRDAFNLSIEFDQPLDKLDV